MPPYILITLVCLAEVFSLLGIATFPSLQSILVDSWSLTNTDVGWINGIYFLGYLIFVPILVSLTDRLSPKLIFLTGTIIVAGSGFGFAYLGQGFWSAMFFRFLAGVGLAGTYMPGLKMLSDQLEALDPSREHSRAIAFYTASFGVGSALSYFIAGEAEQFFGWENAFLISSIGAMFAFVIVLCAVPRVNLLANVKSSHFLDFRPIVKNPEIMGYVFAYAMHNFELFAYRSWVVSYLLFVATISPDSTIEISATLIAAATNIVGLPSSVIGNELARRLGRHRVITAIMLLSAVFACLLGFAALLPFWLVITFCILYGITVTGESSSITAGVVAASQFEYKGATMAVYSSIGFVGSFLGPLFFGIMLDISSMIGFESKTIWPWVLAFAMTGLMTSLGPVGLAISQKWKKK